MKKILICLCLFLSTNVYAKITAYFSRNPVKQGESVELILSSNEQFKGVANIEIVQNDFLIGGQQQRQSSQWINGKGSTEYQLSYTLFPNKAGSLTIHGLKVGTEKLPDITLEVKADDKYESTGTISLLVDCPNDAVYPAQKILCSVSIDDSMGIVDGEIVAPQVSAGTWEQISPIMPVGVDTSKGKRYQSLFAFNPLQSGKIKIPPFVFQGQARLKTRPPSQSTNLFDLMSLGIRSVATRPVNAQSKAFTVFVKEKPSDYRGWWLPSTEVTLSERYDLPSTIHVGDPISRTLTLKATGVAANELPIPEVSSSAGLKVYANPEQRTDLADGSELTVTLTFVPTQPGELLVPEIHVPWFNVVTEKTEKASVKAKSIFVEADSTVVPEMAPPVQPSAPKSKPTSMASSAVEQPVSVPWLWMALIGLGAFVIGIGVALLLFKHKQTGVAEKKKKPLPDLYPF